MRPETAFLLGVVVTLLVVMVLPWLWSCRRWKLDDNRYGSVPPKPIQWERMSRGQWGSR